jgi:small subunit ribosomal protein S16
MSVRIRLRRLGAQKRPFYRIVVTDQRNARDGRFIEIIGKYHPLEEPSVMEVDEERAMYWLRTGAQPSDSVRTILSKTGIWDRFVEERPKAKVVKHKKGAKKVAARTSSAKAS